jgi:hypothetical protein
MYISTYSWPRHLLEVSHQLHNPGALVPEKEPPILIGQEAGWTPEPFWTTWRGEKSCPERDSNPDLSAVQPVASRYIKYKELFYFVKRLPNQKSLKNKCLML